MGPASPQMSVLWWATKPRGSVVGLGDARAGCAGGIEQVEERGMEVGEVGALGEPVVHLGVDVDGVLGAPRRVDGFVPDALQVGGEGAGAGAGDEQIAAVLEVEREESVVHVAGFGAAGGARRWVAPAGRCGTQVRRG